MESYCVMGTEFQSGLMKKCGDGWWGWLHNDVNVLNAIELCLDVVTMVNFMRIVSQFKIIA